MNRIEIEGRCAADADSRRRRNGTVAATRLLVEVRQPSRTDILPVVVWNPARSVQALQKGDPVRVDGQLHRRFGDGRQSFIEVTVVQRSEAPAEDGVSKPETEVVAMADRNLEGKQPPHFGVAALGRL